jgi:hypothetical protein
VLFFEHFREIPSSTTTSAGLFWICDFGFENTLLADFLEKSVGLGCDGWGVLLSNYNKYLS